jgi:hypothetical protein
MNDNKFKIVFENGMITECRLTKKFIGWKDKEWQMDWTIERRKKYVEILVYAESESKARKLARDIYKSHSGLHEWHGQVVGMGGDFPKVKKNN